MRALRATIGLVWMMAFLAGRDMREPVSAPEGPVTSTGNTAQFTALPSGEFTALPGGAIEGSFMEEVEPRVPTDLFGNEVEESVADYRIDPRGDVYERHSPETAVPRPGSPTT